MKIIVDMMGGDNAPLAVLEGAAAAVKEYGVQLIGVGDEALVRKTAADNNISLDGIELVNCTEVIEMCDEPARAIRTTGSISRSGRVRVTRASFEIRWWRPGRRAPPPRPRRSPPARGGRRHRRCGHSRSVAGCGWSG